MKTIALRFGEHFAPECGTIKAHEIIINKIGYVWYGKLGSKVSKSILDDILKNNDPKILLISSGKTNRYWAYISDVRYDAPNLDEFPKYYLDKVKSIHIWFKVTRFELAPKDIMADCIVTSSGEMLGMVSKKSMSPYFKIEYKEK